MTIHPLGPMLLNKTMVYIDKIQLLFDSMIELKTGFHATLLSYPNTFQQGIKVINGF